MECWLHDQRSVNGETNIAMSSFAERQAQQFWPWDQLLLNQQELYGAANNTTPLSSWQPDRLLNFDANNFNEEENGFEFESLPIQIQGIGNFNEEEVQQCGFVSESLPIQMQEFGDFQFIPMPDSQDEDYGYTELNLPTWQSQSSLSEVCCREVFTERPRNSSFYTLEDVMEKLPRVSPLLIPSPPMSPGIPPSPQFSSEVSFSSCLPFSGRVSCQPMSLVIPPSPQFSSNVSFSSCLPFSGRVSCPQASLQSSEAETEHLNQLTQLQSCRKPQNPSVEPQSIAARHRRSKIREKTRSLEKLIPQGSKLDTARMLDEAIKYLKFLKAQVQVLEDYADSKPDLKSNPNGADDITNIFLKPNFNTDYALAMQITDSAAGSPNITDQMLHTLLTSCRIQKQLFSAGKIMVTVQQKKKLASTRPNFQVIRPISSSINI